ncbi:3-oxoacyl-[acyl-carrier-protein] reductase FabG-like [Periplaneta americana]|uniref:3-oxoacyl-[acyl-carrier-protein] reductase FabG-like n=1 Tax=Periplaneta americana TaxID=6978 RepID=UPI0037E79C2F
MSSLANKVVLITGASSGIGAGTAVHFASFGCRLALCGRNEENLQKVVKQCNETGLPKDKIISIIGDVCIVTDCERIIKEIIDHYGQLDVLINSAGILISGSIETTKLDDYDKIMNTNVRSLFVLNQLAVPHLIKTKGNIVNVSSVAGLRSFPGVLAYCISKSAVDQMTQCMALELADRGVRVNAVNPGVIITEIHKRGGMSEEQYQEFLEKSKTTHALGRPGTVDEVAKSIAFLASDDASFSTGVTLPVDGGRGVMCPR